MTEEGTPSNPDDVRRLRQRDYVLRIARALSAQLDPDEVLALVIRSAVTMTGGSAGAIVIRRGLMPGTSDEPHPPGMERSSEVEIVASYHLEEHLVEYVHATSGGRRVTPTHVQPAEDQATSPGDDERRRVEGGPDERRAEDDPAAELTVRVLGEQEAVPPRPAPMVHVRSLPVREPHHVLRLPLRFSGEEIGQIIVFRTESATLFTEVDEDLLRAFADQAAVAIGNSLLHERLSRSRRQLHAVVDRSPAGMVLLDTSGHILLANPTAAQMLGATVDELHGRHLRDVLHLIDEQGAQVPVPIPRPDEPEQSVRGALTADPLHDAAPGGHDESDRRTGERWIQLTVTPQAADDAAIEGYVGVMTDLTSWRESERAKTAFLAGLSHELKTPLSLIRGFAETLGTEQMRDDETFRKEAVEVILQETGQLTRKVDQLLQAARATSGSLQLQLHETDLAAIVSELVDGMRRAHPDRRWELQIADRLPVVVADPDRLRELVANLLSNARKYSGVESLIHVTLQPNDRGELEIRVRDEGRGMTPETAKRAFDRFWRADETVEGTGLGLYMAQAIAQAHGGALEIQDTAPGRGTTMVARIPRTAPEGRTGDGQQSKNLEGHQPLEPGRSLSEYRVEETS